MTGGDGVDLVYDGVGGEIGRAAFGLLRDGGRFMVHGMASGSFTAVPPEEVEARGLELLGLDSRADTPPPSSHGWRSRRRQPVACAPPSARRSHSSGRPTPTPPSKGVRPSARPCSCPSVAPEHAQPASSRWSAGIQLGGRFSMKDCIPSRGSSECSSVQNIVS